MTVCINKWAAALILVCLAMGGAWLLRTMRTPSPPKDEALNTIQARQPAPAPGSWLEAREKKADDTSWAKEMLAQDCARTIETFWDALNATNHKFNLIANFPAREFILGQWNSPQTLPHGIMLYQPSGSTSLLTASQWLNLAGEFERAGWQLENAEFRHNRFDANEAGQPRQSTFYFAARLTHPERSQRAQIEGDLIVNWEARTGMQASIQSLDASHLTIMTRIGDPPFQNLLQEDITPAAKSSYSDPLILYDLDGDGLSEIILAAKNVVYRRDAQGHYQAKPLCRYPPGYITTAVMADFDGDGCADFLCAKAEGLHLFKGSPQGAFNEPGRLVWAANPRLLNAMVLACGDIDEDGDLDLFLAQYRVPTLGQILRPNYYDANDGHPASLLLNDGRGSFTEATQAAGLGRKRWRRTYSASFVDLDGDNHLDLVVVSDFAGLDLYRNDGHGHFTEVTSHWVAEPHAFGMAHALADFNSDGRLDFLMIGMPSPSADRLEHLGLWRPEATEDHSMRSRMSYGNRLYLAQPHGGFTQTPLSDTIARSGWSWGCAAFDFDNDGFPDVYIANGLESKQSVRDYEPEFWLHDIYVDKNIDDLEASAYFLAKYYRTRGQGWSYGGYEKNRLFLNQKGAIFAEIGHLMGVALETDSRNVAADDLDGDGRVDLLVATLEVWPQARQTLRLYQNSLLDRGHWIGLRFREEAGKSPVGVRATIHYQGQSAVRQLVTGDSHRSQHANTIHFGLGNARQVDRVEICWPGGQTMTLNQPAVDQYYWVHAPNAKPAKP